MNSIMTALLIVFAVQTTWSQIPQTISYQGVLTDNNGTPVPDGNYTLTFKLYQTATGGAAIWSEIQTVQVAAGVFNVMLGSVNAFSVAFDRPCWLAITVGNDPEMTPRIPLTAAPYSLQAQTVSDSAITSEKIVNGQVVRSINSIKDDVVLAAGQNISISQNGKTITISATLGSAQGNTLDQAYDEGGPGAGRTITADAGAVNIEGPDGLTIEDSVGVGTTMPYTKLDVEGDLRIAKVLQAALDDTTRILVHGDSAIVKFVRVRDIGAQGPTGATGPEGPKGDKGDTGDKGPKGDKGNKGDKGDTGATGPAGATGTKGDKGNKGDIGATGPAGTTGTKGDRGDKGDIGATGPAGTTGTKGDKGDIGATGPAGATGTKGDKGDKGDIGATGPAGATGAKGDKGDKGDIGDKGDKGDIGLTGPPGAGTPAGSDGQVQYNDNGSFAGAANLFYDDTNNRVGIGTTTPSEKLEVVGNIRINSTIFADELANETSATSDVEITANKSVVINLDEDDNGTSGQFVIESNGNATPDLFKVTETGFTSIDANSATGGLRVDNAGGASTAPILELRDNGTTRVKVTRAGNVTATGTVTASAFSSSSPLLLQTGGTTRIHIDDTNGNVGIGTTTPNEQLEITKNFRLPASAAAMGTATAGVIFSDGNRYIHNFGTNNFFAGVNAGNLTMSGFQNTGVGENALINNTTGKNNMASGAFALPNNTTGDNNTASGAGALFLNEGGENNTAVGEQALRTNTTGDNNTAVGEIALFNNTTGSNNTAVGGFALDGPSTGSNNTALGFRADVSADNLTNATAIGANALVDASNKVRIGDTNVTLIEGQVDFTFTSDSTKKENFLQTDGEMVLRKLRDFRLTSWNYKGHDPATRRHYGPMAQDFFAAFGRDDMGIVGTDTTLTGSDVSGINMIAIQALEKRTAEQEKIISAQHAELQRLKKQLASFEGITAKLAQLELALQKLVGQKLPQEMSAKVKKASVAVKANALQTGPRE